MKKKLLILISATLTLTNCDLDVLPRNSIPNSKAVSTSKDVESLLVGAYSFLGDADVLGGDMQRDAELIGDDGEVFWDGTFVDPGEIWTKNMLVTNGQAETTWLDCYRTINICNTVLANLDVVNDDKLETVEGEAKFIRGLLYFELVKVYARTWTDTNGTPATNPGVPIILEPNTAELVGRHSVSEVYIQIINDLEDAKTLLGGNESFFASTYAASAVLSRVYLMQNNYTDALTEANRVIQSNNYKLLDSYASNFNNTSNGATNATSEDIFAIQVTNQAGVNDMNTFFASSDFAGRGDIYIEPVHLALYDPGDSRRDLFYEDDLRTGKWNNPFGNVNFIRLAEMYLTRAECNFRLGTTVGVAPLTDINLIRTRAHAPTLGSVSLTDILNERHLELAFEGQLIHDKKRTHQSVGALAYNAPELIFPIPKRETTINPDLEQNEGY